MRMTRSFVSAAVLFTIAQGGVALADDGYTCNAVAKKGWCTEYPASSKTLVEAGGPAKMANLCGIQGGAWTTGMSCPAANDLGSCKSDRATRHAYTAAAQSGAQKTCKAPSTWVNAK